jgi:ABC-type dipeptide/oligopeptide/nickel transport system permease subunit
VTGYFRGLVDDVIGRVIDAWLAVPVVVVGLMATGEHVAFSAFPSSSRQP